MADPLTVDEVQRFAKDAAQALAQVALPQHVHPNTRRQLARAQASVNELLLLCELVDVVHDGLAVVVEPDRWSPA